MLSSLPPTFARLQPRLDRIRQELAALDDFRAAAETLPKEINARWGTTVATVAALSAYRPRRRH